MADEFEQYGLKKLHGIEFSKAALGFFASRRIPNQIKVRVAQDIVELSKVVDLSIHHKTKKLLGGFFQWRVDRTWRIIFMYSENNSIDILYIENKENINSLSKQEKVQRRGV